jgi:hypothetical protein
MKKRIRRSSYQVVKDNVKELTDLLFDRDEVVYFDQRIHVPIN